MMSFRGGRRSITWEKTGRTWERYDAMVGGHNVPVERDPAQPLHGFS